MKIHSILYPTDYSEIAKSALDYAVSLARDYQAHLIILHAVETLGPENVTFGEAIAQLQPEAYRQRLWEEIHHIEVPDANLTVEYVLSEEDPVSAILHSAAKHQCDLIVLGSHGRKGMQRWLEGSIAEQVMRQARCPVLIVKCPPAETAARAEAATALHPQELTEQAQE